NGDYHAVTMADAGLGPVLLLGLGWSFLARAGRPNRWALALALMFGLGAILRTNSGSQLTSLVCFLALVRTLMLLRDHRSLRLCMVAGLLAAAASSLRHLNLPFPLLLLLAFLPGHFRQFGWRGVLRDGVVVGVSWLVFLAPWMAALYASNATPIYPLIKGYHNPAFNFAMPTEGWRQIVETLGGVMLQSQIPAMLAVVPAALLLARDRTVRNVQWAALAGAAIIVASFPAAAPLHMARYIQPTLATACFLALMHLVGDGVLSSRVVRGAIAACVVLGLGHVAVVDVDLLWTEANHTRPLHYSRELIEERLAAYAEGQRQVPAGAPIFVYVSAPFGFDQGRNRILNADEPGPVSPPPGLPFFKGGEAVAAYLQSLGIRHVAFEDYDTAATWCISPAGIDTIVEPLWQPWKPYLFDLMANMRELGRTRRVLYASHGVWVVDLGEPVAQTRAGAALHIP
ncbi:MAG TPA: hypothetical protein VK196_05910, partial [Magnetospirillum sp.]|nr:hypothetical protein [Magnetospirillum sp.]